MVVVELIGSPVVGLSGLTVLWFVEQSVLAKEFGIGIATKSLRPNIKVVSDFVHLHVLLNVTRAMKLEDVFCVHD